MVLAYNLVPLATTSFYWYFGDLITLFYTCELFSISIARHLIHDRALTCLTRCFNDCCPNKSSGSLWISLVYGIFSTKTSSVTVVLAWSLVRSPLLLVLWLWRYSFSTRLISFPVASRVTSYTIVRSPA